MLVLGQNSNSLSQNTKVTMPYYGRSFPLEWIWVKHIPFKHMWVEYLFPWGSTYLVYSIFKWKCLLSNCKLYKNACSWYVNEFWRAWLSSTDGVATLVFLGKWIWVLPENEQKLSVGEFDKNANCHIFLPWCLVFYIYLVPKYTHYPYILI